jgi:hypothetical protein
MGGLELQWSVVPCKKKKKLDKIYYTLDNTALAHDMIICSIYVSLNTKFTFCISNSSFYMRKDKLNFPSRSYYAHFQMPAYTNTASVIRGIYINITRQVLFYLDVHIK